MTDKKLTAAQQRAYDKLCEIEPASPRELARALYPDSPGWSRRTRKFGGYTGAVGGTMPMIAARVLWSLHHIGFAYQTSDGRWRAIKRSQ